MASGERQKNRSINEGFIDMDNSECSQVREIDENPTVNNMQNYLSYAVNGSGGELVLDLGPSLTDGLGLSSRPSTFPQDGLNVCLRHFFI